MPLEPKHLTVYLDYELLCNVTDHEGKLHKGVELTGMATKASYESYCFVTPDGDMPGELSMIHIEQIRPLLYPLSHLHDEINGGVNEFYLLTPDERNFVTTRHFTVWPYKLITKLIEKHYDVFKLIEAGLADLKI